MTVRNNSSFRPSVECLEARQLMTAGLAALPTVQPPVSDVGHLRQLDQPLTQQLAVDYGTALKTSALTAASMQASNQYSAFTITNNTRFNLTFSIRWDDQTSVGGSASWTSWQTYTLQPGYRETFYIHAVNMDPLTLVGPPVALGEQAQIYFATSTAPGHTQTDNLSGAVVNGVPTTGSGTHYEFLPLSSTTLNLYQGG